MGYTITEKILLQHIDKKSIHPDEFIYAKVDFCLGNDITAPIAIQEFLKSGSKKVFDNKKIALISDHFAPAKDMRSANQIKILEDFAKRFSISHYYELGRGGIEHALLPEKGLISPGDLVIGADSHTCTYGALGAFATGVGSTDLAAGFITGRCWFRVAHTIKFIYTGRLQKWVGGKDIILYTIGKIGVDGALYKAMEFSGSIIKNLGMDERLTICNMAIEAGGKSGIIEPDEITLDYVKRVHSPQSTVHRKNKKLWTMDYGLWTNLKSDKDAKYFDIKEYDLSKMEPQVAAPHLPSNTKGVSKFHNVKIDQVVIGSCTNGRITDLRIAAKMLKGKKINSRVRLIVIPATQKIYKEAIKEGLVGIFVRSGGTFMPPTCGPCIGGHMGVLAEGETAIATTNRNFVGRMGSLKSFVYLSNPAVAAASALKGKITHPEEVK